MPSTETRYILQRETLLTQNSDAEGRMFELCSEMILEPVLQDRLLANFEPTSLRFEVITLTIVNWTKIPTWERQEAIPETLLNVKVKVKVKQSH